jgi:outer membrane protein
MRINRKSLFALLLATLALAGAASAEAQQKIAVVDSQRLLAEAPQARAATQTLENEFGPRQKQLEAQKKDFEARAQKFERDQATMAEAERTKTQRELRDAQLNFERRAKEFQEDVQMRQNEELQRVQKAIFESVRAYAKEKGYDIVLASGVIYASEGVDITAQVLANLQAKAATAPAAPTAPAAAPAPKK